MLIERLDISSSVFCQPRTKISIDFDLHLVLLEEEQKYLQPQNYYSLQTFRAQDQN